MGIASSAEFFTLLSLLNAGADFACPDRDDYFCLSPDMAPNSLVQERDFHKIANNIISLFETEIRKLELPLELDARWESPFLGAGLTRYGGSYNLIILGGTARMEYMTKDAFAALVCHELGHLIGGAPYQELPDSNWASIEGQSDFFAASECLPKYFQKNSSWDVDIYRRVEEAGYFLFKALKPHSSETAVQSLERGAQYLPPVKSTIKGYPSVQCRYETFRSPYERSRCWFASP